MRAYLLALALLAVVLLPVASAGTCVGAACVGAFDDIGCEGDVCAGDFQEQQGNCVDVGSSTSFTGALGPGFAAGGEDHCEDGAEHTSIFVSVAGVHAEWRRDEAAGVTSCRTQATYADVLVRAGCPIGAPPSPGWGDMIPDP